jgi:hypothetical protein
MNSIPQTQIKTLKRSVVGAAISNALPARRYMPQSLAISTFGLSIAAKKWSASCAAVLLLRRGRISIYEMNAQHTPSNNAETRSTKTVTHFFITDYCQNVIFYILDASAVIFLIWH